MKIIATTLPPDAIAGSVFERCKQSGVNTAEPAVAHADQMIARSNRGYHLRQQLVDVVRHLRPLAHGRQRCARVPVQTAGMAKRQVSLLQATGQLRRHAAQLHGVAARLEDGQDAVCVLSGAI